MSLTHHSLKIIGAIEERQRFLAEQGASIDFGKLVPITQKQPAFDSVIGEIVPGVRVGGWDINNKDYIAWTEACNIAWGTSSGTTFTDRCELKTDSLEYDFDVKPSAIAFRWLLNASKLFPELQFDMNAAELEWSMFFSAKNGKFLEVTEYEYDLEGDSEPKKKDLTSDYNSKFEY
jgi:hypothetical protein